MTSKMSRSPAVLIVGSGPSGLIAALVLRNNDISVRIIDRRDSPHGGIRGTALMPRTLEILESLCVLPDVAAISTPPYLVGVHSSGKDFVSEVKWAEEADESPGTPYVGLISVHQSVFEQVLRDRLKGLGTEVEFGVEMVGFEQDSGKVVARVRSKGGESVEEYAYMIAADGAKGTTRKMLGLSFLGETRESEKMFVANVECTDVDRTHWHRWGEFGLKILFLKPVFPAPMFQIQAIGPQLPASVPHDTEGIQNMFDDISNSNNIKLQNASWISEWRANIRMVNKFSVGRVYLVGDAAHCHSPAGGQGANTAILDAVNLCWKIALVHKRIALSSLLDSYEAERMPVVAEMLNLTNDLHHLAFTRMPPSTLGGRKTDQNSNMWRSKQTLQLGVNYRWSPIVLEGRDPGYDPTTEEKSPYGIAGDRIRAGDRAPDATLLMEAYAEQPTRLFKIIEGCNRHTVLVFTGHESNNVKGDLQAVVKYWDRLASIVVITPTGVDIHDAPAGVRTFVDVGGNTYAGYEVSEDQQIYVVIRPDGIIGAFARTIEQLQTFFSVFLREDSA